MCDVWLQCSDSVSPVLFVVSAGFTVSGSRLRASLPQESVCASVQKMCVHVYMCVWVCVCVCQLERSWRTGAPLPRQHFLVINDFFLPLSLSLSLSLSLTVGMVEIDDI